MENFTPLASLAGGLMIGIAASLLLRLNGHIAGISGIMASLLPPWEIDRNGMGWRLTFLAGLILGAATIGLWQGGAKVVIDAGLPVLILGGLITGIGTRLGSGCTSGHSVCGIARFSARSIAATGIFFLTTALTVYAARHVFS